MRVERYRGFVLAGVLALAGLAASPAALAVEGDEEPGLFRTRVSPHVAGVFIEGEYHGTAAMFATHDRAIELAPGTYDVELVDPRFKTLRAKVTIESGKTSTLRRAMEPRQYSMRGPLGELRTEDFGNAAVYLNDKYYGNTMEFQGPFARTLLLPPGEYRLKIAPADGSMGRETDVEIRPDMTLVVGREKMKSYEERSEQ